VLWILLCHRTIFFSQFSQFQAEPPGKASTWRRKCPASKLTESSNSMRQDSGSPPRLNFVELVLLPPKSPLWFFRPHALVLFSVRPLRFILQWSALMCYVPHRSSVFTLAFASLGAGTRRSWSGLGFSYDFLSAASPVLICSVRVLSFRSELTLVTSPAVSLPSELFCATRG
jgi:hypothetical protein